MKELFFWKSWSKIEQLLCSALLFLLLLCTVAAVTSWYIGLRNVVLWDVLSELEDVVVQTDTIKNPTAQTLFTKAYLVKEQFVASTMKIEEWPAYCFVALVFLGLSLIVTALSTMNRQKYLIGMGAVTMLLAFCHFEVLENFGIKEPVGFAFFSVGLVGISYYFNAFREDMSVVSRLFVLSTCSFFCLFSIAFFTANTSPMLTIASHALPAFCVLSLGFMVWISVELITGFVYVVTNRRTGLASNSLISFLVISVLYLLSIFLIYLNKTNQTTGDLLMVSPFLLLMLSVWLGLWQFQKRSESFFSFREAGIWLYVGLSFVLLATLLFCFLTQNNPLIDIFETTFVYGQLSIGIVFVGYVGINFWPLFKRGYDVHKVLFKPLHILMWQVWAIGGMGIVGLLAINAFRPYYQFESGRFNALGDLYTHAKDYRLAESYYQLAMGQDAYNHKTNYALASLALLQGDRQTAGVYFRQAIEKNPSPEAFVGLSNVLLEENLFFDAIFNLRKGAERFAESGEIQNNLGYLYSRTKIVDSTFFYLDLARQNCRFKGVPQANLVAFFANNSTLKGEDFEKDKTYNSLLANELIFNKNKKEVPSIQISVPPDSGLSVNNFAYLYNRAIFLKDTSLTPLLQKLEHTSGAFYDELMMARAYTEYYGGTKINGLDLLASKTMSGDTSAQAVLARQTLNFWLSKENISKCDIINRLKTDQDFIYALRRFPLNVNVLTAATQHFNKAKQPKVVYQAILNALRFRANSPDVQKLYILQCLELYLVPFAEDGLNALYQIASPADYEAFLKVYERRKNELIATPSL